VFAAAIRCVSCTDTLCKAISNLSFSRYFSTKTALSLWLVPTPGDLSILGEAPATFVAFEAEVQRGYARGSPAAYAAGRAAVLQRFLSRRRIYETTLFRDRYEANAQANIAVSPKQLAV
jgi:hypothetical protein